ncbi:hypothetical protein [Leifsonia shinshuensis]|uniref:GNAT family N-acetyltransferase n=1 Tax=Leifsonia shinshuensis TaxID=150026 RepID=A0A7G6YDX7_9MICO|nr:hypothetical protein [Leifsonia shinshuensis]QNE36692.1 hypothetical protein F1C12_17280 [Leifsonia shinshuensis]
MPAERAELLPITADDATAVASFLHRNLNQKVPVGTWLTLLAPPWPADAPNRGFQLVTPAGIVGAYVAVYSEREIRGETRRLCNLAAFCVLPDHRADGLRLIRALLRQPGFEFTDLSPSGNVVALDERLGFVHLDTATRITPNLPAFGRRGVRVSSDPAVVAATLRGADADTYRDHRDAPASRHIVVVEGDAYAYLIVRRDRRKGLPLFATPIHAGGDTELLRRHWARVGAHLLGRHRLPLTLAEHRTLGFRPRLGVDQRTPRAKMFRSHELEAADIDYLYSELTLLEW